MAKRLNILILVVFLLSQTIIGPISSTAGFVSAAGDDDSEGANEVDKTALTELLEKVEKENYEEENYQADSFKTFVEAITAGEEVAEKADATEEDVNEAVSEIEKALDALQKATSPKEEEGDGEKDTPEEVAETSEGNEVVEEEVVGEDEGTKNNNVNQSSAQSLMNLEPAKIEADLDEFNITIDGKSIEEAAQTELEQGANVAGNFVFKADLEQDGANIEGAWFTFELPDTILDFGNSFSGNQAATETSPAFKYSVSGQTVTVELTEDVDPTLVSDDATFILNFNATFDLDGNNLEQELEIPKADGTSGSDTITLTFKPNSSNEQVVQKKSNGVTTENGERYIEWEIWVNKNGQDLNNATLEDTPSGAIHEIVNGSVTVTEYPVGLNGPDEDNGEVIVIDGNLSDLTMNGQNAYKVTYKTKVDIADADGNYYSGQQNYSNNAVVKEGDETIGSDNSGQNITFGKALDKSVKQGGDYRATWEIIYNYNLAPIDADDAVITDTVTGPHVLDPDSITVYEVTVDDSGEKESEDEVDAEGYTIVESSEGGFEIKFNADTDGKVTKAYRVVYDTVYDSDDHPNFVVDGGTVENTAESGTNDPITEKHQISEGILSKGHTVNFDTKEITWTITINNNGTEDMTDVIVEDDFTDKGEHTLVGDENDITVNGMTGHTTTVDQDPTKGFTIAGGTIAQGETATITYKTKFAINADGSVDTNGYKNIAKVDWEDSGNNEYSLEKDSTYNPGPATVNNGIKKGSFNYETQEFTWRIQVNTNKQSIAGAVLTDTLGDGHELKGKDDSSFTVTETTLGSSDEFEADGDPLDENLYTIEVSEEGKVFTLTFADNLGDADNKVYLVTYKTVDSDDILGIGSDAVNDPGNTYTNDVGFKTEDGGEFEFPNEDVVVENANKLIGKSATPNWGEGTYTWTLNVNYSHSNLGNVTVTDTPSENLMLLPGSIEYVYKNQNQDSGGLWNDGDWKSAEENDDFTLTYTDEGGFELDLGDMSKKAVDIRYKTLVLGEAHDEFSNEASIEYSSDVETSENQKTDRPVSGNLAFSSSDASASVTKGSIKIYKTGYNAATGATKPLEGVKFQLIKTISGKDYIIKEGTTDENGELTFENISYGTFKLVEETPEGYKPLTGYESFVVNEDNDFTVVDNEAAVVNIVNEEDIDEAEMCPNFTITIENVEGNPDANKKIKLVNENTGEEFEVETDDDGKIIEDREDLPAGKYTVYENGGTGNEEDDIYIGEITVNYEMEDYEECSAEVRPEVTSISGTKTWKDGGLDNAERPEITIQLLADGKETETVTLTGIDASDNDDNVWEYQFENLRKLNNAGDKDIVYTVKELAVDGYDSEQDGTNFVNTRTSDATIEIPVEKVWEGPKVETEPVTINLLADGKIEADLVLSEDNEWKDSFENLAIYDSEGEEIEYTVEEVEVEGYNTKTTGEDVTDGFIVTNTQKTYAIGDYVWVDYNSDGTQDESEKAALEGVIVELYEVGNDEPIRTTETDEKGLYIFDELVAGDYQVKFILTDEQAKKYKFTKQGPGNGEDSDADVDTGLTKVIKLDDRNDNLTKDYAPGFKATEGIDPTWDAGVIELTEVTVTKTWKDDDESERPDSINVNLKQNDTVIEEVEIEANDDGEWTHTFTGLTKYVEEGKEYEYTVSEQDVAGYATSYDQDNYEITNTRSEEKSITINKAWLDNDDATEKRPELIEVELFRSITDGDKESVDVYSVKAEDDWSLTIDGLPAFDDNGKAYTYSIEEIEVEGYESTINGFDITNLRTGTTEVSGTKTWDHQGATDLPESITVQLLGNDKEVDTQTVTAEDDWTYTFTGLDQFDENGEAIKYTIDESEIAEYNKSIEGHDITNTRKTYAIGDYVWIDRNKDGVQDENEEVLEGVIVELYDENGEKVAETTTDENGRYIFDELVSGDYQVKFTLTEEQAKKYKFTQQNAGEDTTVDSDADEKGWTTEISLDEDNEYLTKEYEDQDFTASEGIDPTWDAGVIELVDVTGTKTWVNDHNESEVLPEAITINLLQNGEKIDSVDVTAEDDWTYSFTALDQFDGNGVAYEYGIEEIAVDGYETSYDGYNVINTKLCEKFTVEVEDEEGKPVTEEEYTFESEDGKKITKKTDKNGKVTFEREELPEGKYTVKDKDGNKVGEIDVVYNVDCEDNVAKVIVPVEKPEDPKKPENPTCEEVEITITENGKPSKDKTYTLTSKDGETKVTITTDKDGKVTIDRDKLPNGIYTVTDQDGNEVGTIEITDSCKGALDIKSESTGGIGSMLPKTATQVFTFIALGLLLIGLGLGALAVRKRKTA